MPEGHTIHRAARDQRPMLIGKTLKVSSPQGRFAVNAAELDGQTCIDIQAYGKHLFYTFENGLAMHIHLGLFGKFRSRKLPVAEPRGAVRVRMISASHVVDINGPSACEVLNPPAKALILARIGPDVLRENANPEPAWQRIHKSRVGIGQLLMDQSVMAGIGNIYRSEILWRQRLHPHTPGNQLDRAAFDAIWADALHLLQIGVANNAIITVDGVKKSRSRYGERVNIFNKSLCPRCASAVVKFEIATRRAFVCNICQPLTV
jgi:endonuclease-8